MRGVEQRVAEAGRLGFERIYVSKHGLRGLNLRGKNIEVVTSGAIEEVFRSLFA